MGFFGPSKKERFAGIAQALVPHGFSVQPDGGAQEILERFLPLKEWSAPEDFESAVWGQIDGRDVGVAEYSYSGTDSEGESSSYFAHVAVVLDPRIYGTASLTTDWTSSTLGSFINAALWIPPFTFVKALMLLAEKKNPDREVGNSEFDKRYVVHAESDAVAMQVFHQAFRDTLLRLDFQGTIEVRDGGLLFSLDKVPFDAPGLMRTLGHVPLLLGALLNQPGVSY